MPRHEGNNYFAVKNTFNGIDDPAAIERSKVFIGEAGTFHITVLPRTADMPIDCPYNVQLWFHDEHTQGGILIASSRAVKLAANYNIASMVFVNNILTVTQSNGNVATVDLSELANTDTTLVSLTLIGNTLIATDSTGNVFSVDLTGLGFITNLTLVNNSLIVTYADGTTDAIPFPEPDGVINSFTLVNGTATITNTIGETFTADFSALNEILVDNTNGTYTFLDGEGNQVVIDTRAPSNPINPITGVPAAVNTVQLFLEWILGQLGGGDTVTVVDNSDGTYTITVNGNATTVDTNADSNPYDGSNFLVSVFNGQPIDDVQTALDALSDLVGGLIGEATTILNNPKFYIREGAGNDANDGSTIPLAFNTFQGMLDFVNAAYIIGDVEVDAYCNVPDELNLTPSKFKGAGKVTIYGSSTDPTLLTFQWGAGPGDFDSGLLLADGLILSLRDCTFNGNGNSSFATAIGSTNGAILNLAGTVRFTGTSLANTALIQTQSDGSITTGRSTNGLAATTFELNLAVGQSIRAFADSRSGGSITFDDATIILANDITVSNVVDVTDAASVTFSAGPNVSNRYETDFVGPGNFLGSIYSLQGTGSFLREIRVSALTYGTEQTYFRCSTATVLNGIGTFTVFDGANYRYGQTGTYHPA